MVVLSTGVCFGAEVPNYVEDIDNERDCSLTVKCNISINGTSVDVSNVKFDVYKVADTEIRNQRYHTQEC